MIDRRRFLAGVSGAIAFRGVGAQVGSLSAPESGLAARLAADPLRPQFHFLPAANWMNDPNGPIYWNGQYHLFCQYNPNGAFWGDMHWAHGVSPDMVHWKHLPVALAPTPGGPDADGCFTGTALVDRGRVHLLYTGIRPAESQCLAVADDAELKTWTKLPQPLIAAPPSGVEVNGFRDPSPWRQGDWWYTVLGSGIAGRGGAILLYRSRDLRQWEFLHILAQREPAELGPVDPWEVWECPELFPLGDRHVLIYSTLGRVYWQSGRLDAETMRFHGDQSGILDYGSYYAAKTQLDQRGDRIVWGWVEETRPAEASKKAGWAGLMSLPRVLALGPDGRLRIEVAPAVNELRRGEQRLEISADEAANQRNLARLGLKDCCGEILLGAPRTAEGFELVFCGSVRDAAPWLRVRYDPAHRDQVFIEDHPLALQLGENEELECGLHVDGSVIELTVNGQMAWTQRFYYEGAAQTLRMRWNGRMGTLSRLSVWPLTPISADRLTT